MSNAIKGEPALKLGVLVKESENELTIVQVNPETPAEQAELNRGDIIIGLNEFPISTLSDLRLALFYAVGEANATTKIIRGGKKYSTNVRLF